MLKIYIQDVRHNSACSRIRILKYDFKSPSNTKITFIQLFIVRSTIHTRLYIHILWNALSGLYKCGIAIFFTCHIYFVHLPKAISTHRHLSGGFTCNDSEISMTHSGWIRNFCMGRELLGKEGDDETGLHVHMQPRGVNKKTRDFSFSFFFPIFLLSPTRWVSPIVRWMRMRYGVRLTKKLFPGSVSYDLKYDHMTGIGRQDNIT